MDCSPPGFFVHGILQARTLEWVAISFSRGSSWPRDRTWVSQTADRFFTVWATRATQITICHHVNDFFPVFMYGCESWTIKKAECQRTDAFVLWCWRLLRIPWTARRSNQIILKEISSECSLEGLILKLKLQHFCQMMPRIDSSGKDPDARKDWRQEKKGTTEDEMVGWHHRLDGHGFEQAPGNSEGQESLACYSPWGHGVRHYWATEWQQIIQIK